MNFDLSDMNEGINDIGDPAVQMLIAFAGVLTLGGLICCGYQLYQRGLPDCSSVRNTFGRLFSRCSSPAVNDVEMGRTETKANNLHR